MSAGEIPLVEFLLMMADRAYVTKSIKDYLDAGVTVVADRYHWSTLAYQKGGVSDYMLESLCAADGLHIRPDMIIYVKVDPKVAIERCIKRGKPAEKYENTIQLERVSKNYDRLYDQYSGRKFLIDTTDMVAGTSLPTLWSELIRFPLA